MLLLAALQAPPAAEWRMAQDIHKWSCFLTGSLLFLVTPLEDTSMMSSQVYMLRLMTQSTCARTQDKCIRRGTM